MKINKDKACIHGKYFHCRACDKADEEAMAKLPMRGSAYAQPKRWKRGRK